MLLNIHNKHSITYAEVMANETTFQAIQGYILVSHGRTNVWLGLVRFHAPEARKPELRDFLKTFGSRTMTSFSLWRGLQQYMEAKKTESDPEKLRAIKERIAAPMVTAIGLSASGYRLFPNAIVPRFKEFKDGFRTRFPRLPLADLGEPFDAVLVLASNDPINQLQPTQRQIDARLEGLASVQWEPGVIYKASRPTREPFGFADALSQPAFFDYDDDPAAVHWKPFAPLAMVLTGEPQSSDTDDEYGSLMAFMKIEQHLKAFKSLMEKMASSSRRTGQDIRSWMMGRTVDGAALMPTVSSGNDFVYDSDLKYEVCPAAAHIRKANPRTPDNKGHRILRRGVPYGSDGGPQGLLFQSFASTLGESFEFIMNNWLLNERFPHAAKEPGMDPVIGTRDGSPLPAGITTATPPGIRSITTVRAGEYFYFPSIPSFSRLDE